MDTEFVRELRQRGTSHRDRSDLFTVNPVFYGRRRGSESGSVALHESTADLQVRRRQSWPAIPDRICTDCAALNLLPILHGEHSSDVDVIAQGISIDQVRNSKSCPLCRLIVAVLDMDQDIGLPPAGDRYSAGKINLRQEYIGTPLGGISTYRITLRPPDNGDSLSVTGPAGAGHGIQYASNLPVLSNVDFDKFLPESSVFRGRFISPTISARLVNLMSMWLRCCEALHTECKKSQPHEVEPSLQSLRLFDVKRLCITQPPVVPKYLALSYVWGSVQMLQLTKANIDLLSEPFMFAIYPIPRTILEAIFLTRSLGYDYLWVDALCIIQDDERDKEIQIANMAHVYTDAEATIVAASGNDAEAGLWRSSSEESISSYPRFEQVGNVLLMTTKPTYGQALMLSKWNTRGWTFQEKLLSRKCLVFTSSQVYFQCKSEVWCEDVQLEPPGSQMSRYTLHLESPEFDRILRNTGLLLQRPQGTEITTHFTDYANIIRLYTQKSFTFEGDVLDAFKGISSVLGKTLQSDFVFGLPRRGFLRSLMWTPKESEIIFRQRGLGQADDAHIQLSKPLFPSWSWAGWVGAVEYLNDSLERNLNTLLEAAIPAAVPEMSIPPSENQVNHSFASTSQPHEQPGPKFSPPPVNTRILEFVTETAHLNVRRLEDVGTDGLALFSLHKYKSKRGIFRAPPHLAEQAEVKPYEFIALASWKPLGFVAVMLIRWQEDVAYRVAVTTTQEIFWTMAKRTRKLIRLG